MAEIYARQGQYDRALEEADKVLALNPNEDVRFKIRYMLGDYSEAEKLLLQTLEKLGIKDQYRFGYRRSLAN